MHSRRRSKKFHLYRSREDRVCCGVCGGIAEYFDWHPWAVRFALIALICIGMPWLIIVYICAALFMKEGPRKAFRSFEEEEYYNSYQTSRSETVKKTRRTYSALDKRLQRLETIVTSPTFGIDDELRNL